uniref:Uncharacterized protein n=1 Tax=Anguilla anguilla TaxID=7936 RepID=A0A0E9Q974_ANGAN
MAFEITGINGTSEGKKSAVGNMEYTMAVFIDLKKKA